MSGREQNNDSYTPGMGEKNFRKVVPPTVNDANPVPFKRTVKEDDQGNPMEIGRKEALDIMNTDLGDINDERRVNIENNLKGIGIPLNTSGDNICNQKEGTYCSAFNLMRQLHHCVYQEKVNEKIMWIVWVLTNPDLESVKVNIMSVEELQSARFNIPFKTIRMILEHCPDCGGDLRF